MQNFTYSSGADPVLPIWSDFSRDSKHSKLLIEAKTVNDATYWEKMRKVFKHDFETLPFDRFKAWTSTLSVPFMSNSKHFEYIKIACEKYSENKDFYGPVLEDPMIGMNEQDFESFRLFSDNKITMNRSQHLGHLVLCGFTPEKLASMDTILELGGGIGEMADIVYKLGFKGKYIIYDFEEISNVQRKYHEMLGLDNIQYISDYKDLEGLGKIDLCIATWSLTEMPLELRYSIMSVIAEKTVDWLVAFSNNIFGLDNLDYMKGLFQVIVEEKVYFKDIPWMPWDGGTSYAFTSSDRINKHP